MSTMSTKPDIKAPVENMQEVDLNDDSESSSEGEPELWDNEEGQSHDTPQVPSPAPSPIPMISPIITTPPLIHREPQQQQLPGATATVVKNMPPPPGSHSEHDTSNQNSRSFKPKPLQREGPPRKRHPRHEEEDVSSRAAVALAAVAAAATANNTSPSAAAQAARAVAQSFVRGANRGANGNNSNATSIPNPLVQAPPKPKPVLPVKLALVKEQLLEILHDDETEEEQAKEKNLSKYSFVRQLASGENDAFLQHLLLLAYYRASDDFPTGAELRPTVAIIDDDGNVEKASGLTLDTCDDGDSDVEIAEEAANALLSLWKTMEGAYNSMVSMLPRAPSSSSQFSPQRHKNQPFEDRVLEVPNISSPVDEPDFQDEKSSEESPALSFDTPEATLSADEESFDEAEKPVVVPDLLPPCTSARGDVTIEFFRACQGKTTGDNNNESGNGEHSGNSDDKEKEAHDRPLSASAKTAPPSPSKLGSSATSVFTSMFSPGRRNSAGTVGSSIMSGAGNLMNVKMPTTGFTMFRKSARNTKSSSAESAPGRGTAALGANNTQPGEYKVVIEREMLGLTVENVLERTVVRTVLAGGPAKKAGAKVGSLIVKVGSVETKNLTHFETIDELRQSQRPLQLVLRLISDDALRSAREEMGRLIRGSGFGMITNSPADLTQSPAISDQHRVASKNHKAALSTRDEPQGRPLIGSDLSISAYSNLIRERFLASAEAKNKKEETLDRAAEKLVWILNLFVIGLQHEAARLAASAGTQENPQDDGSSADMSATRRHSFGSSAYHHNAKDYSDAARSVSKILLDFVRKYLDPASSAKKASPDYGLGQHVRNRRKGASPIDNANRRQPTAPGVQLSPQADSTIMHEKPLLQIGDVLHRTRTFLADPTNPPAALLRGELIAFLCDVLDIDTEMELSEEEAVSATQGGKAGPITDLGSAGSLLKLIVLNCSIMRSPECESVSSPVGRKVDVELMNELRRRFGGRAKLDGADVHRLHAGNRFLSVVHRLAASRSTSARITACSLGPVLWGHLDFPHQLQLRGVITRALHDAEVIVRKSTATVLHEIAELVFDQRAVPWLILMCERAMTDPEPQLRSAAMTLTWHLAEHLPNAFLGDASQGSRNLRRLPNRSDPVFADVYLLQCKLLPVATRLAEDRAPSVRLAVAAQCDRLSSSLGDHWSSVIIDVLLALLTDSDERVRCEAVLCVPRLAENVLMSAASGGGPISDVSVLEALLPAALMLQMDKTSSVRVALATAAGELLTLLVGLQRLEETVVSGGESNSEVASGAGKLKKHVDDVLIPLVQGLLHDKDPEVTSSALRAVTNASRGTVREMRSRQMSVASEDDVSVSSHVSLSSKDKKEPVFLPVLSEAQVLRLLPTLSELGNSKQWRVRQSAVEIVPALLGCTRNMATRKEIAELCIRLMGDSVDAVRRTAAECLCLGGGSLGSHGESIGAEWITTIVIPHIRKFAIHPNAKQRLLSLKMIEVVLLSGACPSKWIGDEGDDKLADSPMRELAVIALSLANDKVPNVRLNVGRSLESAIHVFEEEPLGFIKDVLLQQLGSEKERPGGGDRDVIFFASRCIHKARVILEEASFPY